MGDEPPGADPQEVVHRLVGIVAALQFLLQDGEGVLPEARVDAGVLLQPVVMDGAHICLLRPEVVYSVGPEELDALLAGPLVVFLLLPQGEQLVDDLEQLLMIPVDGRHANIKILLPNKL